MLSRMLLTAAIVAGALSTSGCYAHVRGRPMYAGATVSTGYVGPGVVVYQAPPAPQVVVHAPPPAPYAGAIWVDGHWQWNGAAYVWADGYYVQPRAGYVYVQPRWERRGTGHVFLGGGWQAHGGGAVQVRHRGGHHGRARGRGHTVVQPTPGTVQVPATTGTVRARGSVRVR